MDSATSRAEKKVQGETDPTFHTSCFTSGLQSERGLQVSPEEQELLEGARVADQPQCQSQQQICAAGWTGAELSDQSPLLLC